MRPAQQEERHRSTRDQILSGLIALALLAPTAAVRAQSLPRDVKKQVDSFTGEAVYEASYGRIVNTNGCGRSDIALILRLMVGSGAPTEVLRYEWMMTDAPFSAPATYLNAVEAFLNIDGEFITLVRDPYSPRLKGSGATKAEDGGFHMPAGTLARIAASRETKLRIKGTVRTCDGTFEPNLIRRAGALAGLIPQDTTAGTP